MLQSEKYDVESFGAKAVTTIGEKNEATVATTLEESGFNFGCDGF